MPHSSAFALALLASLALGFTGCPRPAAQPPAAGLPQAESPLKLVVVDDPALGQAIAREWLARTELELEVLDVSAQDLVGARRVPGDVIVFPSGLLGQLAESELLVPLSEAVLNDPEFNRRDIFDQIRLREMTWGNQTLAVPVGSPQLLLSYRPDIFAKLKLSPPKDWAEYQARVDQLADRAALGDLAPAEGEPWRATMEPLAETWAGQLLLARAAAAAMHRDQVSPLFEFDTAAPLIEKPPYVQALEQLVAAAKAGGFADQRLSPTAAVDEVRAGRAAMAIGWPGTKGAANSDGAGLAADSAKQPASGGRSHPVAFALLPGSAETYDFASDKWDERSNEDDPRVAMLAVAGRMAAVTSSSAAAARGEALLVWLAGSEASAAIGPTSGATTLFRQSQIPTASRWTAGLPAPEAQQYARVLSEAATLSQTFPGLRLPGRVDYLAALDRAVLSAVAEGKPASAALQETAAAWQKTTGAIGVDAQKRAILYSVGEGSAR